MQFIVLILTLLLTACGGGGSDEPIKSTSSVNLPVPVANQGAGRNTVSNIAVGDLNSDGLDDIVIGGWGAAAWSGGGNYVTVLIQNLNGTMTDRTVELLGSDLYPGSNHIFIGDFDHDGYADIWLPGFDDWIASVPSVAFWGNASGQFTRQTVDSGVASAGSCVHDLNGDGHQDILVKGTWDQHNNTYGYYLNNGNRTFSPLIPSHKINGGSTCTMIRNADTGHLAVLQGNTNQLGPGSSISIVDANLNLITEIAIPSPEPNNPDRSGMVGSLAVDMNSDGKLDLVLFYETRSYSNDRLATVWLNQGNDQFAYAYSLNRLDIPVDLTPMIHNGVTYYTGFSLNGDPVLFQLINGQFVPYRHDTVLSIAKAVGAVPDAVGGSAFIWGEVIYRGRDGLHLFIEVAPGGYYTRKL